jgi:NAD(P)-dependent dehydrogenase (short-subunit alcohol dehydrogenase family)
MGLTHAVRTYGWDKGIRATAIGPGWVRTTMGMTSPTLKIPHEQMTAPEHAITQIAQVMEGGLTL